MDKQKRKEQIYRVGSSQACLSVFMLKVILTVIIMVQFEYFEERISEIIELKNNR